MDSLFDLLYAPYVSCVSNYPASEVIIILTANVDDIHNFCTSNLKLYIPYGMCPDNHFQNRKRSVYFAVSNSIDSYKISSIMDNMKKNGEENLPRHWYFLTQNKTQDFVDIVKLYLDLLETMIVNNESGKRYRSIYYINRSFRFELLNTTLESEECLPSEKTPMLKKED